MNSSAIEILARQREGGQAMLPYLDGMMNWTRLFAAEVFKQYERSIPRAPYTDDMWQMLADMGVEPRERRWWRS